MKIIIDNIYTELQAESEKEIKVIKSLSKELSVMAPGAIYMQAYQVWKRTKGRRGWNGRVCMMKGSQILTGLVPQTLEFLRKKVVNITLCDKRNTRKLGALELPDFLRDYQKDVIRKSISRNIKCNNYDIWWPRGVIKVATGGGKTKCAAALIKMVDVNTCFIVHRDHLIVQAKKSFEDEGIECGVVGSGVNSPEKITVATAQTLQSRLKRGGDLSWIKDVEQIFFDEAHLLAAKIDKANAFVGVCNLFDNAFMRWGLTGTPFMRDNYSNWILEGVTSDVIIDIPSKKLIKEGHLIPPNIRMIKSRSDYKCPEAWPACYEIGIMLNNDRNDRVVEEIANLPTPCLILVDQIGHGEIIQNRAKKRGIKIPFLNGETNKETRKKYIEECKKGNVKHILASTIFDEGLDIPNLRSLILAGGKKSPVKYIQRLGRGLRKEQGKDRVEVIDFYDLDPKVLERHSKARLKTWKEQGFEPKIVE